MLTPLKAFPMATTSLSGHTPARRAAAAHETAARVRGARRLVAAMLACSFALAAPGAAGQDAQDAGGAALDAIAVDDEFSRSASPYVDPDAPWKVDHSASPKLTEPLLDTPKSIAAIPKEVIRESGATSVKDVFRTQPGIAICTGETFSIERIEIPHGPSATIGGRGALGSRPARHTIYC